jgi:hypothetical protein
LTSFNLGPLPPVVPPVDPPVPEPPVVPPVVVPGVANDWSNIFKGSAFFVGLVSAAKDLMEDEE